MAILQSRRKDRHGNRLTTDSNENLPGLRSRRNKSKGKMTLSGFFFATSTLVLLVLGVLHLASHVNVDVKASASQDFRELKDDSINSKYIGLETKEIVKSDESQAVDAAPEAAQVEQPITGLDSAKYKYPPVDNLARQLFELYTQDPYALVAELEQKDPFGAAGLADPRALGCPPEGRRLGPALGTAEDLRNHTAAAEFRQGKGFLFYQHIRKAGGTGFCDMTNRNMRRSEVPRYFCMADNKNYIRVAGKTGEVWTLGIPKRKTLAQSDASRSTIKTGSFASPPWRNPTFLRRQLREKGHRIVSNEWDAFTNSFLTNYKEAVFATTLRDPIERWFSQYRFEHVEHRDGTKKGSPVMPFEKWLPRQAGLGDHYYLKCFVGDENLQTDEELMGDVGPRGKPRFQGQFYWTYRKFDRRAWAWEDFRRAQELLLRFNLVLVLEWIDYSVDMIDRVLGWKEPPKQVLPWNNNQRKNTTSWSAKANIPEQELLKMKASNALDLLLYHWVKRIVAERLACQEY